MADERALAERLISYDTSRPDGLISAVGFVKGWLESRDVAVRDHTHAGLPVLRAEVGRGDGPKVILHGHVDVVPARPEQFSPRVEGDRLIGRGAYDMKGALAAMMCALHDLHEVDGTRVELVIVPDEESDAIDAHASDELIASGELRGDFAITGEPTDLHIGVQAKGVLMMRLEIAGRAAHGSTPWLGDNAVLKAVDVFRRIESMPFAREASELFDRPSINLGRIDGGDAVNKVPDACTMAVDVRYLPGQDPGEILAGVRAMPDVEVSRTFIRPPAIISRANPFVRALRDAVARSAEGEIMSVGRDGASDAVSFLEVGIPAVEFGPRGAGHHGPDEWVSISSLAAYRRGLVDFVRALPAWLERDRDPSRGAGEGLRAIEGGLA
jgi:succinyl-diaminopimelate desuccinylase